MYSSYIIILYLLSAFLAGMGISQKINIINSKENVIWSRIAMSISIGILLTGWTTYIFSYAAKELLNLSNPKVYGNITAVTINFMFAVLLLKRSVVKTRKSRYSYAPGGISYTKYESQTWMPMVEITNRKLFFKETVFFVSLFAFILYSMFYVFYVKDGNLYSGVSVFSDYAPHTAVIRSFSLHNNFPTQYPHFGGEDIKYHFMFQFFIGNLEFIGMRIDWAFNLISALSLWSFLVLLYFFAKDFTQKSITGVIVVLLFFCRSSFAVLYKIADMIGNILQGYGHAALYSFLNNTEFIGDTLHEDWGLWNYNVFLNQRHLGFGLSVAIIVIIYYYKTLKDVNIYNIKKSFLTGNAWIPDNVYCSVSLGILLGAIAFWNGAVVIAALLILFGMAVMSQHKLDYLITAVIAITLSFLQTSFFIDDSVGTNIGINFQIGFLAEDASLKGILVYLLQLSGIFFIGIFIFILIFKGMKRIILFSFMIPVIFAFTVSMTPDITVNHKYIIISTIFLNILWSYAITKMLTYNNINHDVKIALKTLAVILVFLLTSTGMYDILTIYNKDKSAVSVNLNSELTGWLKTNITEDELVLTGEETISEITLSGVMMYNGWPYYAWSAGYDTDTRAKNAIRIYTTDDKDEIKSIVESEGIDYIIYQRGMTYEGNVCRDDVISKIYKKVFECDGYMIYKTK